jgi:hypothetical protein
MHIHRSGDGANPVGQLPGHLTRINDILTTVMEAERRVKKSA